MLLNCHIGCIVLGLLCVGVWVWFGWGGSAGVVSGLPAEAQLKNETANIVVQQHRRILLKMGVLIPEAC